MNLFLCLYQLFVEEQHFFESYETSLQSLKQSAEAFVHADSTGLLNHYAVQASHLSRLHACCFIRCLLKETIPFFSSRFDMFDEMLQQSRHPDVFVFTSTLFSLKFLLCFWLCGGWNILTFNHLKKKKRQSVFPLAAPWCTPGGSRLPAAPT